MNIVRLDASDTHQLRRLVLRSGDPDAVVAFAEDDHPDAFHLGARSATGDLVGVASFSPQPCPRRPDRRSLQLRGMAVLADWQRSGFGRRMIDAGRQAAVEQGFEVLWANARDSALEFYRGVGFVVEGDGFLTATGIPHHMVIADLA